MSIHPYLGTNVNAANIDEILYRGLVEEGETLLAIFDGMLLDEHGHRVGGLSLNDFVVLTDVRLLMWARGFFNDTLDSFAWKDVDVADANTWDPLHGRVRLAFRLPPVAARARRIVVKGVASEQQAEERVVVNTLDYMPADDVAVLAQMVEWVGDQVISGMARDDLLRDFVEQFPQPEQSAPNPFFAMANQPPPAFEPQPTQQQPRRWWQANQSEGTVSGNSPSDIVSAYEQQRSGASPAEGAPRPAPMRVSGQPLPEQPSMYDVTRSLRLMMEAPRRITGGLRRASQAMSGTNELINGMQDPQVRSNAMRGLRQAIEHHEAEQGPLAPVGPVARAVIRFSEPIEPDPSAAQQPAVERRRIRVQRQQEADAGAEEQPAEQPARPVRVSARRSVSVRRTAPSQVSDGSAAPQPTPTRLNVRRINVEHSDDEPRS